jgi:hypothetical protein
MISSFIPKSLHNFFVFSSLALLVKGCLRKGIATKSNLFCNSFPATGLSNPPEISIMLFVFSF